MSDAIAAVSANRGIRGSHDERRLTTRWTDSKHTPIEAALPALPSIEITGRVLAEFVDYDGLWGSLRARVDAMGISREELDRRTGLADRYCSKILGPSKVRKLGKHSLGPMLGAVCCKLVLVEDPIAAAKMAARAKKRKQP
jgi:hypothetical protein